MLFPYSQDQHPAPFAMTTAFKGPCYNYHYACIHTILRAWKMTLKVNYQRYTIKYIELMCSTTMYCKVHGFE